jgi:hypothetical protein
MQNQLGERGGGGGANFATTGSALHKFMRREVSQYS